MDENTEKAVWRPLKDFYEYLPDRYKNATDEQKSASHWGSDFFVVQDYIDAITKDMKPAIDVYEACEWTAVGLLSELSIMNGGRVIDMPKFWNKLSVHEQIVKIK